jgi:hypothetical protein
MENITKSKRWIEEEKEIKKIVDARRIIGNDVSDDDLILAMIEDGYTWNDDAGQFGEWE